MKSKKVFVITGSRAEYGLLKNLMFLISKSRRLDLKTVVTGSHLSSSHGHTYKEILEDGLKIDYKIDLNLLDDTTESVTNSISKGITKFHALFKDNKPDLIIILGDRYELLSIVIAAAFLKIPIAHIHGGEVTEGAIDDYIRHTVTKFSHIHFVANDVYKSRVIQLGEQPRYVRKVGGMGVDMIKNVKLKTKKILEKDLGIKFLKRNLLITFHPATLESTPSKSQIKTLISAIENLEDCMFIFTMPNADPDSSIITDEIQKFCKNNDNAIFYKSLGYQNYLSCMKYADGVIGNSSSGILEAPVLKTGTINIGSRQAGRLFADSIIQSPCEHDSILASLNKLFSNKFKLRIDNTVSPYGSAGASIKILKYLEGIDLNQIHIKEFYDIPKQLLKSSV
jgi:UDP-hydrolysing UDP-N-acetyl-D-glucosamine 2-epimerase